MNQNSLKKEMSFFEHLEELRKRFIRVFIIYLVIFLGCAYFAKEIFTYLQTPLLKNLDTNSFFIATTPLSGWLIHLQSALFVSLLIVVPYILIEFWLFIKPGLKKSEAKIFMPLLIFTSSFFFFGCWFGLNVAFPAALQFLTQGYQNTEIRFLPEIKNYFSFLLQTTIGFGFLFETPFIILMIVASGIISTAMLKKYRSYIYILSFVIGAILTPPDIVSQCLMAIPFILLFEFGLILTKVFKR